MTLHDANEATEKANEQVRLEKQRATELENELKQVQPVSYTHLTLPTIYSV